MNTQRIFCIGRNYSEHAKELNSEIPTTPVIFLKPASCLVEQGFEVKMPKHGKNLHHEVELVIRIGKAGNPQSAMDAISYIDSFTIGLDLTLRDVQNNLKDKGLPWELSKAFDQSSPIGSFVKFDQQINLNAIDFKCFVNADLKQQGNSKNMIFSVESLIFEIGKIWKLLPGDLIYTGTPAGVGPIKLGDTIIIESKIIGKFEWKIIE